ncbi:alkaline phosphatase family protein [Sphingomonas panacisoli]|uniref:Alkaline phosphatase n=1 Tax=Sphingomonas panacisoli TaxID=1813879 RepID=A0A5B8LFA0_9SPHN|nr:alkaline phosphatase family protein [Sphingomonas panacisoli]QDZ06761.1 alkaline phosphatase family protein [Sphingomonas panacisoli]
MRFIPFAPLALLLASPLAAQDTPPPAAEPARPAPKLIVVISVDQFSADLFAEYRNRFTGGFKRLLDGAVFPAGYQSHAATETCPGHSTIMTGDRPARTGIIANDWVDLNGPRPGMVYCAEDERVPGSSFSNYTASDIKLRVPTLGERLKNADPRVRTVSVAGKDRAAIMMGGHKVDQLWFWRDGKGFISYSDRAIPASVGRANVTAEAQIAKPGAALVEPAWCKSIDRPIVANGKTVGNGRFARPAKNEGLWKASPAFDTAIFGLATAMVQDMKLGRGPSVDVLTVGASATDYVGHGFGTEGSEMCIQLANLDQTLGKFFAMLDKTGVDYVVALTADHGGNDIPERERERGMPMAARMDLTVNIKTVGDDIAGTLGLKGPLLFGGVNGDVWISNKLSPADRDRVRDAAVKRYAANPQVAAVFTKPEIAAATLPAGPPETWSLLQRARASFDTERSGDISIFLKPRITPIPPATTPAGTIATHGSIWDYDRRVPILFWRRGMAGFEQPLSVETVDIMPSLAALVGFALAPGEIDGRCLDLDGGPGSSCP